MRIKPVVELSDFEATAIAGTLATLNEILKYADEEDTPDTPELDNIWAAAERAMIALKDFYKECYLEG